MAIAKLSIDLEARLAGLQAGLDKAGLLAQRQADKIEAAFSGVKDFASGIGIALAGAFSAAGLVAFFKTTVDGLDALNDLSDATGSSIENLSALEDIAARTGTSMDTVGGAVIRLNKTLADAKPGSDAAAALTAIGLSAEELKKIDPAEALQRTAVALAGFADDGNKARLTQELFGKSLREVAPLLKDLADNGALNATVTTAQAKAAEAFNIELFRLQKNVVDTARSLSSDMVPALNKFFAALRGNKAGGGFFASIGLEFDANTASDRLRVVVGEIEDIQKVIDRQGATSLLAKKMAGLREEAKQLSAEAAKASDALKAFAGVASPAQAGRPANEGGGGLASRNLPSVPDIQRITNGPAAPRGGSPRTLDAAGLDEATISALRAIENTDTAKIEKLNATLDALFSMRASGIGGDSGTDAAIAAVRDELAKLDPAAQAAADSAARLNSILAQTPTGQYAAVLADVGLINAAFADGKISADQWAEAARAAAGSLPQIAPELEKISAFADQAGRNIQDALGSTLADTLKGDFDNIGERWRNLLLDMAAQAAAAQLNSLLFGNTFGGGGEGSGVIGDFVKGVLSGTRANGGPVSAGGAYLVGERGPEVLQMGGSGGMIVPNHKMGGMTVVQNVTINGDVSPGTVKLVEGAMSRVKADILRSSRTGGAYAGAY